MWFEALIVVSAIAGGAVAGVTGFGAGSFLTPALALQTDARLAVAAVSIPHLVGTALRCWLLRGQADRRVLWSFGVMSAGGGLTGALLHGRAASPLVMVLFGAVLLFSAGGELTGLAQRMRFHGAAAWIAGAVSGVLGGLVGNQGGIRSAALLGVALEKHAFVATSTAVGLMVDAARVPVYVWQQREPLVQIRWWVALGMMGVAAGTVLGHRALVRLPEPWFRRTVAVLLAVLGAAMVWAGVRGT